MEYLTPDGLAPVAHCVYFNRLDGPMESPILPTFCRLRSSVWADRFFLVHVSKRGARSKALVNVPHSHFSRSPGVLFTVGGYRAAVVLLDLAVPRASFHFACGCASFGLRNSPATRFARLFRFFCSLEELQTSSSSLPLFSPSSVSQYPPAPDAGFPLIPLLFFFMKSDPFMSLAPVNYRAAFSLPPQSPFISMVSFLPRLIYPPRRPQHLSSFFSLDSRPPLPVAMSAHRVTKQLSDPPDSPTEFLSYFISYPGARSTRAGKLVVWRECVFTGKRIAPSPLSCRPLFLPFSASPVHKLSFRPKKDSFSHFFYSG